MSEDSLRRNLEMHARYELMAASTSDELTELSATYVEGRIRFFGSSARAQRTEIDLEDGRTVKVHQNMKSVIGLAAPRYDKIEVFDANEGLVDTIELSIIEGTSPTYPSYRAKLRGRELKSEAHGSIDKDLADSLFSGALAREKFGESWSVGGHFGSCGDIDMIVPVIKSGYTPDESWFRAEEASNTPAEPNSDDTEHVQQHSRLRRIQNVVRRMVRGDESF